MPRQRELTENELLDALAAALEQHSLSAQKAEVPEEEWRKGLTSHEIELAMQERGFVRSKTWWSAQLRALVEAEYLECAVSVRFNLARRKYRPPVYRLASHPVD